MDTCSIILSSVSSVSAYYPSCTLAKTIGSGKVNVATLKTSDCLDLTCQTLLSSMGTYELALGSSVKCTLTDTSTGKSLTLSNLTTVCDGITASSSGGGSSFTMPPSYTLPTNSPYTFSPSSVMNPSSAPSTISPFIAQYFPTEEKKSSHTTVIVVCICVAVVVIAIAAIFVVRNRKRNKAPLPPSSAQPYASNQPYEAVVEDGRYSQHATTVSSHPSRSHHATTKGSSKGSTKGLTKGTESTQASSTGYSGELDMCDLELHRVARNDVHLIKVIAQGAYGEVWLGEHLGSTIAVKRLLPTKAKLADVQKFIWEIHLLSKIECPNVVQFLGVAWTKPSDMLLLTEYMDGGDLRQVLESNQIKKKFTWTHKLKCALSIAEGLVFLHTMDPKIVHRDLKSRNVLLDSSFNAKITDFGIAREIDDSTLTAGIGTYRWIAPEVLQDGHYSESADIFSLGVILSELDTEIIPYSDLRNNAGKPFTDTAIMAKVMSGELKPSFTPDCPRWYVEFALECMALDPELRPPAMKAAYQIRSHIQGFI
ncbi:hypothetical protein AC1031_009914 [Aphanomyces cochlioides]|nr:hypothetical protein AC1031_009914 [Aphanomyces cochlioides]